MNKSELKNFAIRARLSLRERVQARGGALRGNPRRLHQQDHRPLGGLPPAGRRRAHRPGNPPAGRAHRPGDPDRLRIRHGGSGLYLVQPHRRHQIPAGAQPAAPSPAGAAGRAGRNAPAAAPGPGRDAARGGPGHGAAIAGRRTARTNCTNICSSPCAMPWRSRCRACSKPSGRNASCCSRIPC